MAAPSSRPVTRPATRPATRVGVLAVPVVAVLLGTWLVTLLTAGGRPVTGLPVGLTDPGPLVGWGLRLARPVALVAAVLTVGSLLVAGGLGPRDPALRDRCLRTTRRAATTWSVTGLLGYVLSVCDASGVPLTGLALAQLDPRHASTASAAHLALASGAGAVAAATSRVGTASGARLLLVVALASALPVPAVGHVTTADDGGASLSGLLVHVVAALLWTGGLAGVVVHLRGHPAGLALAVPRFSVLALGAYLALAGSGLVTLAGLLPLSGAGWSAAWSGGYAAVVAAKVAVLGVLGVLGWQHRRRTLAALDAGRPRSFLRLATGELLVMGAALGLAAGLSATPVPPLPTGSPAHSSTRAVEEISVVQLVTAWRPNALVLLVVAVGLAAYLVAARSTRDGTGAGGWPRRRTVCFATGCALAAALLCSGVATYSSALVSVHVAQLLATLLAVPALLLLGHPGRLARESASGLGLPGRVTAVLEAPAVGALATFALLTLLYRTPLVTLTLRSPWWHLLVLLLAVACGTALLWPLLGEPRAGPPRGWEPAAWLMAVATSLGVLALRLGTDDRLVAAAWFAELRLGWVDPLADQRLAGLAAAVAAAAVVALSLLAATRARA